MTAHVETMAPVPDPNKAEPTDPTQLHYTAGPEVIQVDSDSDSPSDSEADPNGMCADVCQSAGQ